MSKLNFKRMTSKIVTLLIILISTINGYSNNKNQVINNATPDAKNDSLIALYNQPLLLKEEAESKTTNDYTYKFGMSESSILSTEELEVSILLDGYGSWRNAPYVIRLQNKTDNFMYIDLSHSFKIYPDGEFESYFNTKQITMSSPTQASILGRAIDGDVNTITHSNPALLIIPPHAAANISKYKFQNKDLLLILNNTETFNIDKRFIWLEKNELTKNNVINYTEETSPYKQRYIITYSVNSTTPEIKKLNFEIYVQQVFGLSIEAIATSKFLYKKEWQNNFSNISEHSLVGITIQGHHYTEYLNSTAPQPISW